MAPRPERYFFGGLVNQVEETFLFRVKRAIRAVRLEKSRSTQSLDFRLLIKVSRREYNV